MIKYPKEFSTLWEQAKVKAAFVSDTKSTRPIDCNNCGGGGMMFLFIAYDGPFDNLGTINRISHYANGKWWVGENFSARCPVCNGTGRNPSYKSQPTIQREIDWEKVLK